MENRVFFSPGTNQLSDGMALLSPRAVIQPSDSLVWGKQDLIPLRQVGLLHGRDLLVQRLLKPQAVHSARNDRYIASLLLYIGSTVRESDFPEDSTLSVKLDVLTRVVMILSGKYDLAIVEDAAVYTRLIEAVAKKLPQFSKTTERMRIVSVAEITRGCTFEITHDGSLAHLKKSLNKIPSTPAGVENMTQFLSFLLSINDHGESARTHSNENVRDLRSAILHELTHALTESGSPGSLPTVTSKDLSNSIFHGKSKPRD